MEKGYIKLCRKIESSSLYRDSEAFHLWVHLLMNASRAVFEYKVSGKVIDLKPGQLVTNRIELSKATGISESKIQRLLKRFESEQRIEQQSNNKSRIITVVNWNEYQSAEQQNEQQKKDKKPTMKSLKPEGVSDNVWRDFIIHRKDKKAPITETAMNTIVKEAEKAEKTVEEVLVIIMDSGWRGFKAEWIKKKTKQGKCNADGQYQIPTGKDF